MRPNVPSRCAEYSCYNEMDLYTPTPYSKTGWFPYSSVWMVILWYWLYVEKTSNVWGLYGLIIKNPVQILVIFSPIYRSQTGHQVTIRKYIMRDYIYLHHVYVHWTRLIYPTQSSLYTFSSVFTLCIMWITKRNKIN